MSQQDNELLAKIKEENQETAIEKVPADVLELVESAAEYDYFRFLKIPTEKIRELNLTKKEAERLRNSIISLRHGAHASVPMICAGMRCPVVDRCSFTEWIETPGGKTKRESSRWPLLEQCPIEAIVLGLKLTDLVKEYNISEEDTTDLAILSKIAELEMLDVRLSSAISIDGLVYEEVVGVTPKGEPFYGKKIHPALEAKDKIGKQISELRKAMIGTRREKERMLIAKGSAIGDSDLVALMGKLMRDVKKALKEEERDYIDAPVGDGR